MASLPDHIRRDAEQAARYEVTLILDRFKRRINEQAKATISERLARLPEGSVVDFETGTEVGRDAAKVAIRAFLYDSPEEISPRP